MYSGIGRQLAYGSWYEAEDVLVSVTDADLVLLNRGIDRTLLKVRRHLGRNLRRVAGAGHSLPQSPWIEPIGTQYDLAVFIPFTPWELPLLEELGVHRAANRVVVYLPELWPVDAADRRVALEPWHLVDDIFVAIHPSVEVLSNALNREVHYLPMAANVDTFRPRLFDDPRPIDVLNIGRRIPELHEALLEWAYDTHRFYVYDTFRVAKMDDPIRHRRDLGQRYQRSSVAICSYPKHDLPAITQGRRIIPQRVWEGLASGAVMIGMAPEEELQLRAVGALVVDDIPHDPLDGVAAIEKLVDSDTSETRHRNIQLALRRHDWVHRWKSMFDTLDLDAPRAVGARITALEKVADELSRPELPTDSRTQDTTNRNTADNARGL